MFDDRTFAIHMFTQSPLGVRRFFIQFDVATFMVRCSLVLTAQKKLGAYMGSLLSLDILVIIKKIFDNFK